MTIQQIEICTRLTFLGSINAVAKSLGVTQPAVSSALSLFEKELGFRLYIRSKKGVALTRKGKEMLPYFQTVIKTTSDILAHSSKLPSDEGTLKLAGRQGFMQYIFPHLYHILRQQYPKIIIETIISSDQDEVIEALTTGRVDLCFAPSPKIKSIGYELLYRDPVFIGISNANILHKNRKQKTYLSNEIEFCLPTRGDRLRKPIESLIKTVVKDPKITMETDDYTLIGKLVANGNFAGPLYGHMLLDDEFAQSVVELRQFRSKLYRDLTVLYRRDDLLPHVATAKTLFVAETARILSNTVKKRLFNPVL